MTSSRALVVAVTTMATLGALLAAVGILLGFTDQYALAERTERGWSISQGLSPALLVFVGGAMFGGVFLGAIGWALGSRVWSMFSFSEDAILVAMKADLATQIADIENERAAMVSRLANVREQALQSCYDMANEREITLRSCRDELVRANKHIEKLNGRLRGAQGKAKRLQRNG